VNIKLSLRTRVRSCLGVKVRIAGPLVVDSVRNLCVLVALSCIGLGS
jgi:hypothetical protein